MVSDVSEFLSNYKKNKSIDKIQSTFVLKCKHRYRGNIVFFKLCKQWEQKYHELVGHSFRLVLLCKKQC